MRAISGVRRFVAWLAITKIFRARTDAHAGYRAKKMHVRLQPREPLARSEHMCKRSDGVEVKDIIW